MKIALGTGREATQIDCIHALIVEFICTFLFVFAGVGSAMAADKLGGDSLVGLFFVAMAHGLVVCGGCHRRKEREDEGDEEAAGVGGEAMPPRPASACSHCRRS
ncbi:unnamed protein product [Camellia sinensis]